MTGSKSAVQKSSETIAAFQTECSHAMGPVVGGIHVGLFVGIHVELIVDTGVDAVKVLVVI